MSSGDGFVPVLEGMGSRVSETRPEVANFQVRRPDTLQFDSLEGLTRMAGVSEQLLRTLILKEVVDNALDEIDSVGGDAGSVTVRRDGSDTYIVEDGGSGIRQDPDKLCDLFSASRPMVSGKFLRRPSRGMLGNGLRVLVSAVTLSGGTITIESRGVRTMLRPRKFGGTEVVEQIPAPRKLGTRITFTLGAIIPRAAADLVDAEAAIRLAVAAGPTYKRPPSPHWLDFDHLAESFATIEPADTTVRQLIEKLDGCSGAAAGKIAAPFGKGRTCRSMKEEEIAALLRRMQESARVVKPKALGLIGADAFGEAYDSYIGAEAELGVGAHEPRAHIPVLIEAWACVTSRRGGDARLAVYCNRTPVVGGVYAVRGHRGIHISGAGLAQYRDAMKVEGGDCYLIVAVTSPFIPTTSLGKAPDLSRLQPNIVEALRRAFTKSRNRLPPDPAQPKPPKTEPPPKAPKPEPYQPSGPLATLLAREAEWVEMSPRDLLVLSPRHDPFNETKSSRRLAEWFAEQVSRFVPAGSVHLRGLYYRCLSAGNVRLPDGKRFVGSHTTADLIEAAGKYARHLGLVAFDRITDERAAPPEFFDTDGERADANGDPIRRELIVFNGSGPLGVPGLDSLVPTLSISAPTLPRQPFRISMIGEKTSLGEVLRPIAKEVHAELLLATGEVSETAVYGIARRAAADGRPLRILYFSDFDPAGWQMTISVGRKLQAHRCREFHDLDVREFRVALTVEQVKEFNLPDSPIKPGEKRAQAWREKWGGREQVEIDALAVLRPDVLDQIARRAVAPYFDLTFEDRFAEAVAMSEEHLAWFLNQPAYQEVTASVRKAYKPAVRAMARLNAARAAAVDAMRHIVENEAPDLSDVVVEPEIGDEPEEAIFDSSDDYFTATSKLQNLKSLSAEDDDD